jgi:type I restriction enzyme S subunit
MGLLVEASTKQYHSFEDSGIDWIGNIPKHWEIKKFKRVFREVKKRTDTELNCGSISFGKVVYKDDEKIPESTKRSYQVLKTGEFLINPLNLNYDLLSLRIALSDKDVVVSSGYIVIDNIVVLNKTYFKYFLHRFDVAFMKLLGSGVRQTLNWSDIANCDLILPPLPEQSSIAEFLDHKTAKIDQAIDIKQKQIELLKERRQILIQRAVTRGLNPNVKMKHSGNDAVGEIPEHWQINKLRNSLKPISVKNHAHLPLLSITREHGVIERNIDDPDENHNFIPEDLSGYKLIKAGQFGMNKMKAWQGSYGISPFTGIVSPAYFVFDLISDIVPSFFHLAIRSKFYIPFFVQASDGVRIGQWDLSKERMKEIPIIIPPTNEQINIVSFIDRVTEKNLIAINSKELEIEKLKEYKTTLVNSAVTGKIKVTNNAK